MPTIHSLALLASVGAPDLLVLSVTRSGAESQWSMSDLLPKAFTPTSLERH